MAVTTAPPRTGKGPAGTEPPAAAPRGRGRARRREALAGYVFLSPWLIGLGLVTAMPFLYSLYLSFTDYELGTATNWIGFDNYVEMFTIDRTFRRAVGVTLVFALVAVPLKLAVALAVALLLQRDRRGVGAFRAFFYVPSLLGASVGMAIVWQAIFSGRGAVNDVLGLVGITGRAWSNNPDTILGTLVLLTVWQFGAPMVIFLAGLKQVPRELYEAAAIDGAGRGRQFLSVTLPLLSPVIFFNLVLETIRGFQGFTAAFVVGDGKGGPANSTMLYTLYLYIEGFTNYDMGYAAALAWVFLAAIGVLTAVLFWTGRFWIHYGDEGGRA